MISILYGLMACPDLSGQALRSPAILCPQIREVGQRLQEFVIIIECYPTRTVHERIQVLADD